MNARYRWARLGGTAGALRLAGNELRAFRRELPALLRRYTPLAAPLRELSALERARWQERTEAATCWLEDVGTDWWSPPEEAEWLAELDALGVEMPIPVRPTVPTTPAGLQ